MADGPSLPAWLRVQSRGLDRELQRALREPGCVFGEVLGVASQGLPGADDLTAGERQRQVIGHQLPPEVIARR